MYQRWLDLTFLHWEVPAADLQRLMPAGLTIDTFEGKAYVGLVPFRMRDIRPRLCPAVPGVSHFFETNVRTYVHVEGQGPGVWFFSLDAANRIGAWLGRHWFKLPYHYAHLALDSLNDGSLVCKGSRASDRSANYDVWVSGDGPCRPAEPGTLEFFLVERYLLYTVQSGHLMSGQVWHEPYRFRAVSADSVQESLLQASGIVRPNTKPLAHYSPGVDVEVFGLKRVGVK
ncbi:MAG: DUF2071 domain-containing protein [Armatimonadetes bacterium]|nr:DUF2071 domain-containing protein [Armatimonadota bacterium]